MIILGVDEVGRGSWAGPLVAGAVILKSPIDGLTDSKLLSKKQREKLSAQILQFSDAYALGWVSPKIIDKLGLTASVRLAMQRAVKRISVSYDQLIVDGNINYLSSIAKSKAIVRADLSVASVSAASVIAKVARDEYMKNQSMLYPQYGFDSNVGYGTAKHLSALKLVGLCPLHRLSYRPVAAFL